MLVEDVVEVAVAVAVVLVLAKLVAVSMPITCGRVHLKTSVSEQEPIWLRK